MKNFKLLLATTAILSMTTIAANAEINAVTKSLTTNFSSSVHIVEPATIRGGSIIFPDITTSGGRTIVIDPDGSVNTASTAQFVASGPAGIVTPIVASGGDIGAMYDSANTPSSTWDINDYTGWEAIHMPPSITLTDKSTNNSGTCGTVSSFVPGTPSFDVEGEEGSQVLVMKFPYGATFEMGENFHPTNGYADCSGSAVITYIPPYDEF